MASRAVAKGTGFFSHVDVLSFSQGRPNPFNYDSPWLDTIVYYLIGSLSQRVKNRLADYCRDLNCQ
ncbi:MAG: hypothetical protein ACE10C_08730 [Candidatus Binatia bacterium]